VHLRLVSEDALADHLPGGQATRQAEQARQNQVTLAVDELAMLALGVPAGRPAPPRAEAAALVARLDQLAAAVEGGLPAPASARGPLALAGYPRTRSAAELLAASLA
jgi:hypothetical protein